MIINSHCPRCGKPFQSGHVFNGFTLCQCGWMNSQNEDKQNNQVELKTSKFLLMFSSVFALVLAVSIFLGSPNGQIQWLKSKAQLGIASQSDLIELTQICKGYQKFNCAEYSLNLLYETTKSLDYLIEKAHIQTLAEDHQQATQTYQHYYQLGGDDPNVAFKYALSLEKAGQIEEAISLYKDSMNNLDGYINFTAAEALVHLLIQLERYNEAKSTIDHFRKQTNTEAFNKEYDEVVTALKKQT